MPRQNLYIARRIYASLEFMHRGNHASRVIKFAHREKILFLAESYASREDSYLAGIHVLREDIYAPQEDIHG